MYQLVICLPHRSTEEAGVYVLRIHGDGAGVDAVSRCAIAAKGICAGCARG